MSNHFIDPDLNTEEETFDSSGAREEDRLLDAVMRDLDTLPRLSNKKTRRLLRQLAAMRRNSPEWVETRNKVVEGWIRLAAWAAREFGSPRLDYLDNLQIATGSLLRAVEQADPDHPNKVSTFFASAIKNALWQAAARQTRPVALHYAEIHRLRRGRIAPNSLTAVRLQAAWDIPPLELSAPVIDEHGRPTEDVVSDTIADTMFPPPDRGLEERDFKRQVQALLDGAMPPLSEDERCAYRLRHGLATGSEMSNVEVGQAMNVSIVRSRQLIDQATKKVRRGVTAPQVENLVRTADWKIRRGAKRAA
jgi:RNA polymerase sigma factor (sigma-70 family)